MNIKCRHCGEPWDIAELHDIPATAGKHYDAANDCAAPMLSFDAARALFYSLGCGAFSDDRTKCASAPCESPEALAGIDALQDLLGDDVDGLASTLEDFEYAGLLS